MFYVPWTHGGGGLVLYWKAGAIFREENKAGVSVIIRDHRGRVIASMAKNFPLPFLVSEVEVIAAKKALKFASELGLSAIVREGDSKTTIDAMLSGEVSLADIGLLIDEAKQYGDQLDEVEYSHVKRQGNKVANNIVDKQDMLASSWCEWRMFLHTSLL